MSDAGRGACAACGHPLGEGAAFCEACGAKVSWSSGAAVSAASPAAAESTPVASRAQGGAVAPPAQGADEVPISRATSPARWREDPAAPPPGPTVCLQCGGAVAADGYCEQCGVKAPSGRDHFRETPASWVAGVCDRGLVHARNEDAMALWAQGESAEMGRAALVVCDGVSSSVDSDVAALAGARAAREVLRAPLPAGLGVPESREAAATRAFVLAAEAANAAVVAHTALSSPNPASCTFVAATIEPAPVDDASASGAGGIRIRFAAIGDSRAYWLPDAGEGVQLTTDDSMASLLIAGGMPRAEAEASPQAHGITKWLGKDSPDIVPVVGALVVTQPGWVLVCSDGLWNYASEPAALAEVMRAYAAPATPPETVTPTVPAEAPVPVVSPESVAPAALPELPAPVAPGGLALHLVEFANAQGGRDNITVALARLG